tara:strand:+ start:2057 stop:2323 length:267 start_codon:yes stop_codon:yes gene_type:complete
MNINPDFSQDNNEQVSAEFAMEQAMGYLFAEFIEPREEDLDPEDIALLGIIGKTFKEMALRADAYDKIVKQDEGNNLNGSSDIDFSRN